jgi:outer membrane beta-barrel protein
MKKKFSIAPIIKKIAPVLLLSVCVLPLTAHAEIKAGSFEVSPFVGYSFLDKDHNLDNAPVYGLRLGYNITSNFGIEGVGEFSTSNVDDKAASQSKEGQFTSPIDGVDITTYHLDLLYHFMPESDFNPFLVAGYGANHYSPEINSKNMSVISFGVGAKYWMAEHIALRVDLRDNMVYDEQFHNLEATVGVVFAFGGEKKKVMAKAAAAEVVADTIAPTVVFTAPLKGAAAVHINQKASVAFSEEMDPATLTAATFTMKQGATPVEGSVTSTDSTATFTPVRYFDADKTYTATVSTGVKDTAGNAMAANYEWGFTTGLASDTTAPTVAFTSPVKGATAAPVKQKINAAFSEAMDPATLTSTTFIVKQGTTPVVGKVTSVASNATFTSAKDLEKGKQYTATVTTGAKDLAGNPLASNYVWDFTAFSPPKVVAVLATLENSHFNFDSAEVSENGKTILNHNLTALKADPKMKLHISGYTSASGSTEYNQGLSERRADAVKNYLVKTGGISADRLTTVGYGETHPAKFEANPGDIFSAAALANMRVIIEVVEE